MSAISVIIPTYNHAAFVGEAIQSVLGQTFRDLELVVVDDGSTDATQEVLGQVGDPRLCVVRQANAGLLAARSAGVNATTAPFVTFLDADDVFLPDTLATMEQYLRAHPDVGLVAGGVRYIDSAGRVLGEHVAMPASLDVADLLLHNPITVSGILLRRTWYERVGGFATGRVYDACGDWHLWLRLRAAGCPFGWVERAVVS
jgi:glycosyltransferase involved in cell wall biosynthesis